MIKNIQKITCLLLTSCMILCGCDIKKLTSPDKDGGTGVSVQGEPLNVDGVGISPDDEMSGYPVTINDTAVNSSPKSVICLSSGLTEMIYELGFGERLTGRGSYCESPEAVLSLSDFGKPSAPDIDRIISAKPDLVITATSVPDKDVVRLSENGIGLVYICAPRSVEEFGRIYCALGMIFEGMFDGEDDGNKLFLQIRGSLEAAGKTAGSFIYVTEGMSIAGGDTFESSVLSYFGTNIAADAYGYVSYSALSPDVQPETVILNSDISVDDLKKDEALGELDAVKNGNIISISNRYFESPSGGITGLIRELSSVGAGEEQ